MGGSNTRIASKISRTGTPAQKRLAGRVLSGNAGANATNAFKAVAKQVRAQQAAGTKKKKTILKRKATVAAKKTAASAAAAQRTALGRNAARQAANRRIPGRE